MTRLSLVFAAIAVVLTTACAADARPDALDHIRADLRADPRVVDAEVGSGQLLPFSDPSIGFSVTVSDFDPDLMATLLRDTAERIWHEREIRRIAEMSASATTEDLANSILLGEALGIPEGGFVVTPDDLEAVFGPRFADS